MPGSVIVSGARTRIGKLNGALASVAPVELGGLAIAEALRHGGVPPEAVDYVIVAGGMESMSKAPHLLAGAPPVLVTGTRRCGTRSSLPASPARSNR